MCLIFSIKLLNNLPCYVVKSTKSSVSSEFTRVQIIFLSHLIIVFSTKISCLTANEATIRNRSSINQRITMGLNYFCKTILIFIQLMPCPSIDPKLFWTRPNKFGTFKLVQTGPNVLDQTKNNFLLKYGFCKLEVTSV